MSEIKRVTLSTLEPQKVSDKVNKKSCKTVRISVILPESNEDNCPEYNYKDQLAAVKRKHKVNKEPNNVENGLDPFTEDDDDVRRIALEMEAKYGTCVTGKKKRKGRKDDYADIGMGYDESDSFIDNTDGYDEIIPQNVTTLLGGFYINSGALEFKTDDLASSQVSSSKSDSEDEQVKSINRKRVLDTSEDSDSDTATEGNHIEKKAKTQSDKNSMQQAIKKKLFSQNKIQKKKRPIDPLKKTVKELLREKREDLNMSVPTDLQKEENFEKDSSKENKVPMSITSVTDAIESVVKQIGEDTLDNNQNTHILDVTDPTETPISIFPSEPPLLTTEGESSQDQTEKRELVKLPENISTDILQIVHKIKVAALDYRDEGKKKFFSDEVNSYLLSLERKCKNLGKSSRLRVYDYLSYFCKVRKETLMRRAKHLMFEDEELRLKKCMNKLKDCVNSSMPALIASFEQETQKMLTKKFSTENPNEENKNLRLPKRRFQWTDETKKLLKEIMSAKKKCLILEGKQKNNLEELMVTFLRHSMIPLWPEGWMYLNNLKKVYNSMTDTSKIINVSKSIDTSSESLMKTITEKSTTEILNTNSNADTPNVDNALNSITPIHSNLTITPVDVMTSATKTDVANSVTVTKIPNEISISNTVNKVPESVKQSADLFRKMLDEISKTKPDETRKPSSSSQTAHDKSKPPEKDYSRTKIINLDVPPAKSVSRHPQETYKAQNERTEQKNHWPSELYGPHKEQTIPVEYPSKPTKHNEEKLDFSKPSNPPKSIWSTKETWPEDKNSRHNETTSSSVKHSSKHPKNSDNPKSITLSVNDILQKPDKHSDSSKHHSDGSKYHSDSSKHHSDSSKHHYSESSKHHHHHHSDSSKHHHADSSKHYSDSTKHYSDSTKYYAEGSKHYTDSSKHYTDSSKHYADGSKHYTDGSSKHYSDSSKHHSDSSKHSKTGDGLKLPIDNNVIVLKTHQSKESDSKIGHKDYKKDEIKSMSNPVIPKSMHCQLMDLSDGRNKAKVDDTTKSHSKYSSSSKEHARSEMKSSKASDMVSVNSANYYNDAMKISHKFPDFSSGSNFLSSTPNKMSRSEGDSDIQMVMENLKTLQKLSCSPVKNESISSPVSVIAFNKNYSSSKSNNSNPGGGQRSNDSNSNKTPDYSTSFQDDFQKQFINSIQMSANPSTTKANYRCS